ncbi:PREDICTED: protein disulfide isomerase-like 1-6 isoform X2 [Ipomoea nil]|uniref:protein disulfide isomerase-like 1-6 isoform X2 n=1 Tax=Ipomoea nil TaxID=35883 RepID=UPI000901154B|nr:PREDICTED: protein disulfide isomerase-like 1-6 isoform X2 [Ipomoea nil]
MFTAKPTSRSVFFSLLLLLLLAIFTATSLSSEPTAPDEDSGDLGDLQELIALDEEADLSSEGGRHESKDKPSGAELLSRAHRIVLELNSDNTKSAIDEAKNQEIVIWRKKKTGAPVLRINSINEATGILQKHSMFVVGLFEGFEGPDYEEYKKAAQIDNEIQFIETSSAEILKVLFPDAKPAKLFLGLVKSEPEKYTSFEGTFNANEILQFLEDNKFPLVSVLTELNSAKVFSSASKLQVFVFAEPDAFKELLEPLQGVAKEYKSKIMLIYADIRDDNLVKPFLTLFGLEEPKDIVVIAFNYTIGSKYLLESTATPRSIKGFCLGVLDGTVPPYYKSQPAPDNKDASILAVVGKTFDDLILNSQKNILLEVHTPWCITCDTTSKQMEKLAKHFKGLENLVFARIDASENEHPKLQVDDYPALLFYSARDKSNPIKFPTKSSLKDLATLINKRLKEQDAEIKDEL